MSKRFKYRVRVTNEPSVEETIFERLEEGAPAIPARYVTDAGKRSRFDDGETYLVNPSKVEDAEHVPAEAAGKKPAKK